MGFSLEGLAELRERLKDSDHIFGDAAGEAAKKTIEEVYDETQVRVPQGKTGALANSGKTQAVRDVGNVREYEVVYGDSDVDRVGVFYAAAVHEILDAQHPAPTGAKYVELPLIEAEDKFRNNFIDEMKKAVNKVVGG
jgi:hypothetical protein